MFSRSSTLGLASLVLLAYGCNKSTENTPSPAGQAVPPAAITSDTPMRDAKVVVTDFLGALRRGDNDAATRLLSKVARQKVAETGRNIAPAANDRVQFEVDEAVFPTPDHKIAHVPARWTDLDEMGHSRTDKATWVCRLEDDGWRVAGFAAYVFEREDPLLLSFEDPEDMAKKQKWLSEEMARRAKQEAPPPTSGENPTQAEKPQDAFRR
jgi:hypothetical protein